jgi:hypothetical protein
MKVSGKPDTPTGREPWYSLKRLDGAKSQPGCLGEGKALTLLGMEGVLGYPVHCTHYTNLILHVVQTMSSIIWLPTSLATLHLIDVRWWP